MLKIFPIINIERPCAEKCDVGLHNKRPLEICVMKLHKTMVLCSFHDVGPHKNSSVYIVNMEILCCAVFSITRVQGSVILVRIHSNFSF